MVSETIREQRVKSGDKSALVRDTGAKKWREKPEDDEDDEDGQEHANGAWVRVVGLVRTPEHNGQVGVVSGL